MDISSAMTWLFLNVLSIATLAFYSMVEMACVSFNKIRLQYYVSKGYVKAIWLNTLLHKPARLFGTTLIGVNVATFVGSECAREFHSALGINPDLAPLSQVFLVIIFGELAPMFAARHYAEHVAMLGAPLLYASARVMTPLLWVLHQITTVFQKLIGGKGDEEDIYLSQEEIQKILEEHSEDHTISTEGDELNEIGAHIFNLKNQDASSVMHSLKKAALLNSNATVAQVRAALEQKETEFALLYHNTSTHIVGVAWARDLIRAADTKKAREYARTPWLVTSHTKLMMILKQFKRNRQSAAIILDREGQAIGYLELDDVLDEIFGDPTKPRNKTVRTTLIEKTLPGNLTVAQFNAQFQVVLDADPELTLNELIQNTLGHPPEKGESIYLTPYEFSVKETSLLEVKTVAVRTRL